MALEFSDLSLHVQQALKDDLKASLELLASQLPLPGRGGHQDHRDDQAGEAGHEREEGHEHRRGRGHDEGPSWFRAAGFPEPWRHRFGE